jgi:tetratricopeptide (TPR) repeat protein
LASFQEAVRLEPAAAEAHANLANNLLRLGRHEQAIFHYRLALQLQSDSVDAHCGLGVALARAGELDEAMDHYRKAIYLRPNFAEAHSNLAHALLGLNRVPEAEEQCRKAIHLRKDYADAHNNLGNALTRMGKPEEALGHLKEALRLRPDYPEAHANLGNALRELRRFEEAETNLRRFLQLQPNSAEGHDSLGNVLVSLGKADEAVEHFERALELRPDYAEAHNNLGIALLSLGNQHDAMAHFEKAICFQPELPQAHYDRAILLLLRGEFEEGWKEYEWRWKQPKVRPRAFSQPLWDGSPFRGRTILLHAEQGIGDTFQFIRFAPLVKECGGRVLLECQATLTHLLSHVRGVDEIVPQGSTLPSFDVHAPLLSLPLIFGATRPRIPNDVPYLTPDARLLERWREYRDKSARPSTLTPFLVGITWEGNPTYLGDRQRSIPLSQFAPLARVVGVQLISLQKRSKTKRGVRSAECGVESQALDFALQTPQLDECSGPFMDTAAIMKSLDLVISSDTAIVHLAGALGVPVWVALPLVPDWRWLLEREDSPWYPTVRLFRQKRYGYWPDVFENMVEELANRMKDDCGRTKI